MSLAAKIEYLKAIIKRYRKASKAEKSHILDEFCRNCKLVRKYAITRINNYSPGRTRKKPGRPSTYDHPEILKPLKNIWKDAGCPCSKNLKALIPDWVPHYEESYEPLSKDVLEKLLAISPSTIDRLFKKIRPHYKKHGLSTTKPGSILRTHIPIKTEQWNESRPGFVESDTVAHCGDTIAGTYANTVDAVDIPTTWTEQRAVWGKGEVGTCKAVRDIEASLPFPLRGFDSDQGSEFLNWHLYRHFSERKKRIEFTTSRAYKKNDNAHVEQKNWTHIRQWLGYERFDFPELVPLMNDLYRNEWRLFFNFFIPSVKLLSKQRVGSKIIKKHDKPKTPYQRVLEHPDIDEAIKNKLKEQSKTLNPFYLRKQMNIKIKRIFDTLKKLRRERAKKQEKQS
jgi:hypothetical protein